jgi:hypothetical protein
MSTTTDDLADAFPLLPDRGDQLIGHYRPVLPAHRNLSLLRRFIGVREEILDWVPEERARYSRLGAIVLNTGLMAAVSLFIALHTLTAAPLYVQIPAALFWGYLIISFDGWLVAGTHGVLSRSKVWVFLPRLIITLLMGAVIAEPLVLAVFQPAVQQEVRTERQNDVIAYTALLARCNPTTGKLVTSRECAGHQVAFPGSPQTLQAQLATTTSDRAQAQQQVDSINAQLGTFQAAAQTECAGGSGKGFTGKRGQGPNCARDRQVADQYRTDSQLDQHEQNVTALDQQINALTAQLGQANTTFGDRVTSWINAQTAQFTAAQGTIDALDEEKALETLSSNNFSVFAAEWFVRLLLIAIDLMPVLAKLLSGTTSYDQLYTDQLEAGRRLHEKDLKVRTNWDGAKHDLRLRRIEHNLQTRLGRFHAEDMSDRADRESGLDQQIEELAAKLRAQGRNPA